MNCLQRCKTKSVYCIISYIKSDPIRFSDARHIFAGLLKVNNPFAELKRFRGKVNIQRPRKPFFLRQCVEDLTKPKMPMKGYNDPILLCGKLKAVKRKVIDNPFERILAKECANWFHNSQMIVFLHLNSARMRDRLGVFADLRIHNMHLRTYGKKIIQMAITGTPYECAIPMFQSYNQVIFSEKVQIAKLCQLIQQCPSFVLMCIYFILLMNIFSTKLPFHFMSKIDIVASISLFINLLFTSVSAAIVYGKFISKDEVEMYSKVTCIEELQSQLCNVLDMSALNVTQQLTQHQTSLVHNLDAYVSMKQSEAEKQETSDEINKDSADSL